MATPSPALATLVILSAIFGLLWPSCMAYNILYSGQTLRAGQRLTDGSYALIMQTDCNLVLYDAGSTVWSTRTSDQGSGCYLSMQMDGNLVIYDSAKKALWSTRTAGRQGSYVCILQRDRNVVVYGPGLWASGTNNAGSPGVIITQQIIQNSTVANAATAAGEPRKIAMVTQK